VNEPPRWKVEDFLTGFTHGYRFQEEGLRKSEGIFRLDWKVEEEIFHRGTLILGEPAVIKEKLEANALILNGMVEGIEEDHMNLTGPTFV